ncbi:hypothetical protein ILYODFUR_010695 [Ilyodon furcidens]|uniref:Uncharacterized protein n=1 Tax=Ilyodon furcidens TaxID=33524 RepID=A0ABV0V4V0_9TELE
MGSSLSFPLPPSFVSSQGDEGAALLAVEEPGEGGNQVIVLHSHLQKKVIQAISVQSCEEIDGDCFLECKITAALSRFQQHWQQQAWDQPAKAKPWSLDFKADHRLTGKLSRGAPPSKLNKSTVR